MLIGEIDRQMVNHIYTYPPSNFLQEHKFQVKTKKSMILDLKPFASSSEDQKFKYLLSCFYLPSPILNSPPSFKSRTPPSSIVTDVVCMTRSALCITPDGAILRLVNTSRYWISSFRFNLPSAMTFIVEIVNFPATVLPCKTWKSEWTWVIFPYKIQQVSENLNCILN